MPLFLLGCAAALVVESNNPRTKIDQATILFNEQDRPLAAAKLLQQAIPLAREKNDKLSEADAEFYLGEIHKNPLDTGKAGQLLRDPKKAVEHHTRAIGLYSELNLFKKASFVAFNKAGAYKNIPDQAGACTSLIEARKLHEKPGAAVEDVLPPDLTNGKLIEEIKAQIARNKCT